MRGARSQRDIGKATRLRASENWRRGPACPTYPRRLVIPEHAVAPHLLAEHRPNAMARRQRPTESAGIPLCSLPYGSPWGRPETPLIVEPSARRATRLVLEAVRARESSACLTQG